MSAHRLLASCAWSAGVAVAVGAFAAHGLKDQLGPQELGWIKTGAEYQLTHGIAGCVAALASIPESRKRKIILGFLVGSVLFAGSLYLMAATGVRALGAITPLGGVLFLLSWLSLGVESWKRHQSP